jgi:hypothetical protein
LCTLALLSTYFSRCLTVICPCIYLLKTPLKHENRSLEVFSSLKCFDRILVRKNLKAERALKWTFFIESFSKQDKGCFKG